MMNKIREEGLQELANIQKSVLSLESNELPAEFTWFQFAIVVFLLGIFIWHLIIGSTNVSSLTF